MGVIADQSLFDMGGPPLLVRDQTAHTPSGRVTVPAVKVVFMLSGWARVRSGSGDVILEAGSVLTIPSALSCWGFPAGHARTVTFYVQPDFLADHLRWLSVAHPLVHQLHQALDGDPSLHLLQLEAPAVRDLAPSLAQLACPIESRVGDFALLAGVAEIFDAVGRIAGRRSSCVDVARAAMRQEVFAALTLLRSEPDRPWRIESLAREIALSPSQLTRLFRAQVGVSPGAFLQQVRADRMAELLAATDMTVGEAGAAVGWADPAIASRSFKRRYGIVPRDYARFHRSGRLERAQSLLPTP